MVEWKKLGEVCKTITPPKKLEKELYGVNGAFPIIDQGQKDIVGYTNDETSLVPNDEYILFGDHTRYVKYFNGSFAQGADGLKILKAANGILPRYFFFSFENVDVPSRGYSRHWSIAKELLIPIPSLEEQTRIVGILDTFTSAIDNLKEQIAQRRKQYEYYRDQLLDLEGKPGVEMKTLGETCIIKNGYTPSTKEPSFWENGTLPWFTLEDIRKNGRILKDAIKHITSLGVKRGGLFPKDSIIISTTATIGEYALIKSDFLCNQQITCLAIKEEMKGHLLPKYLYYLSDGIGKWCKSHVNGGGSLLIVSTSKLIGLQVPLPTLLEQQRIVSILDTFEASIQNLEAQLSQREKQYEYYRNKLLTFD